MGSQNDKFHEFKARLAHLVLKGKIDEEREKQYINHIRASLKHGDTELTSHLNMSDDALIEIHRKY